MFIYVVHFNNNSDIKTIYIILSIAYFYIPYITIYSKVKKYNSDDKLMNLYNGFAILGFVFSHSHKTDFYIKKLKIVGRIIYLLVLIDLVLLLIVILPR